MASQKTKTRPERDCQNCGKAFSPYPSQIRKGGGKYCSPQCWAEGWSRERRTDVTCRNCGKTFTAPISTSPKYCSKECYYQHQATRPTRRKPREKRICPQCGNAFQTLASKKKVYCSHRCAMAIRRKPRVKWTCEFCGKVANGLSGKNRRFCSIVCRDDMWRRDGHPTSKDPAILTCSWCGKEFEGRSCQRTQPPKKPYCSDECRSAGSQDTRVKNMVACICTECGEVYYQIHYLHRKYCDKRCSGKSMSRRMGKLTGQKSRAWKEGLGEYCGQRMTVVRQVCPVCGLLFTAVPSQVAKGWGKYCSRKCRDEAVTGPNAPYWKGGPIPYGQLWPAQRERTRNRDNHRCQLCGATEEQLGCEMAVHHIKPFRESKDNTLGNLICLCSTKSNGNGANCHGYCEHHPEECPQPRKHWLLTA